MSGKPGVLPSQREAGLKKRKREGLSSFMRTLRSPPHTYRAQETECLVQACGVSSVPRMGPKIKLKLHCKSVMDGMNDIHEGRRVIFLKVSLK